MHRLEHQIGDDWVRHEHLRTYETLGADGGRPRLLLGVGSDAPEIIASLAGALSAPFAVLYVLHTVHGEAEHGRYQSEPIDYERLSGFMSAYAGYLRSDSRFDLWIFSEADNAQIVWDRHNYLYAYGPIDRYAPILSEFGYVPGKIDRVSQRPHMHFYRPECDASAHAILDELEWTWSPLRPEDEQ